MKATPTRHGPWLWKRWSVAGELRFHDCFRLERIEPKPNWTLRNDGVEFCTSRDLLSLDGSKVLVRKLPEGHVLASWTNPEGTSPDVVVRSPDCTELFALAGTRLHCLSYPSLQVRRAVDVGIDCNGTDGPADRCIAVHPLMPYVAIGDDCAPGLALWNIHSAEAHNAVGVDSKLFT